MEVKLNNVPAVRRVGYDLDEDVHVISLQFLYNCIKVTYKDGTFDHIAEIRSNKHDEMVLFAPENF